jgi:hypothetical protein
MKGQEINPHFYYLSADGSWIKETKVYDKNGNIVQPEWTGDFGGWQGKLPSTQDYIISLKLNEPKQTSFILEILNIPQRQESGYFNYTDKQNGFEITYSQDDFIPYSNQSSTDVFSVSLDTKKYFSGTTLQSSDLIISIFPECLEPYDSQIAEKTNFNDVPFKKFMTYDATATTGFEIAIFQTHHNNLCYQILVRSSYFILGKLPDSDLKDFSRSILYTKIYRLLNTFKFTE